MRCSYYNRAVLRKTILVLIAFITGYLMLHDKRVTKTEGSLDLQDMDQEIEGDLREFGNLNERETTRKDTGNGNMQIQHDQATNTSYFLDTLRQDELKEGAVALDFKQIKYENPAPSTSNAQTFNFSILTVTAKFAPAFDIALALASCGVTVTIIDLKEAVTGNSYGLKFPQSVLELQSSDIALFHQENKDNVLLETIDAFLCIYPIAMCKLFLPFHKPLIVYAEDRYEAASHRFYEWTSLNDVIAAVSHDPRSSLLASNSYDVEYIRYFTGFEAIQIPFTCSYLRVNPTNSANNYRHYLLWSTGDNKYLSRFVEQFRQALFSSNSEIAFTLSSELSRQDGITRATLNAEYSGIIVLPHQVSFLAFTELYRMNIPLFVPSLDLLTQWHHRYQMLHLKGCRLCSLQSPHLLQPHTSLLGGVMSSLDPNNDSKVSYIGYWLMYSDFYRLEHLVNFSSVRDLVERLAHVTQGDLEKIRANMAAENTRITKSNSDGWQGVLSKIN